MDHGLPSTTKMLHFSSRPTNCLLADDRNAQNKCHKGVFGKFMFLYKNPGKWVAFLLKIALKQPMY